MKKVLHLCECVTFLELLTLRSVLGSFFGAGFWFPTQLENEGQIVSWLSALNNLNSQDTNKNNEKTW